MKKVIISILIVILVLIAYWMMAENFKIGNFSIQNIKGIQALDEQLKQEIATANKKTSQEYVSEVETLKTSIKDMVTAKQKYEKYNTQGELGLIQIKTYKVEYLWAIIGQYAKNRNTQLTLDLVSTGQSNLYDLDFTLIGDYSDIVDCLTDIENDDAFNFKITNFAMEPYRKTYAKEEIQYSEAETVILTETENKKTTIIKPYDGLETIQETDDNTKASSYDPKRLIATFKIEDVGIEFN